MSLNIYLIRKCLLPLRNPLTIENIPVFHSFEEAYAYIYKYMERNILLWNGLFTERNGVDYYGTYYSRNGKDGTVMEHITFWNGTEWNGTPGGLIIVG